SRRWWLRGVLHGELSAMSAQSAVSALLSGAPALAEPVAYIKSGSVAAGSAWADTAYDAAVDTQRFYFAQTWWINAMLNQPLSITEKMTLFWHNHFATSNTAVKDARYIVKQNELLREYALGNVKDLVRQITLDPAMLRYLSGNTNTKTRPNENYARELQELFTLGKGPERSTGDYTTYTEDDVKAAARVLTGWSDVQASATVKFTAANHDGTDKKFSAAYGDMVISGGTTEVAARREIDDLLTMIFARTEVAERIVRKLYRWFVDYEIDDTIEREIIRPLADRLRTGNYEIKPVLATLLGSSFFFDAVIRGCLIKSPVDFVIGTLRNFRAPDFFETDPAQQFWGGRTLRRLFNSMQQEIFNSPNVAGWAAYYQAPQYHEWWINTDSLQKRVKFINDLATDGMTIDEQYDKGYFDVIEAAKRTTDPSKADVIIREWCGWCFALPMPDESLNMFKQALLGGLPEYEWTVEWNAFVADETNDMARAPGVAELRALVKFMLNMAEYHVS
ncbi:MAG: DUF1800 family protein, partial [Candidatus Kapaibacterium sp.]